MRGDCIAWECALVNEEDIVPLARQKHRCGRPGTTCSDDYRIVTLPRHLVLPNCRLSLSENCDPRLSAFKSTASCDAGGRCAIYKRRVTGNQEEIESVLAEWPSSATEHNAPAVRPLHSWRHDDKSGSTGSQQVLLVLLRAQTCPLSDVLGGGAF